MMSTLSGKRILSSSHLEAFQQVMMIKMCVMNVSRNMCILLVIIVNPLT